MFKTAATAYKDRMHILSDESLKRLREPQPKDKLTEKQLMRGNAMKAFKSRSGQELKKVTGNSAAMKSDVHMIAGMNRGSKNIIKKNNGFLERNSKDPIVRFFGGYSTKPGNSVLTIGRKDIVGQTISPVHKTLSGGLERAWMNALGLRHEAIETKYSKNSVAQGVGTFVKDKNIPEFIAKKDKSGSIGKKGDGSTILRTGAHHSPGVLVEEADLLNRVQNRNAAKHMQKIRTKTGERDAIHQKIGRDPYGPDGIRKGDAAKAHNSKKGLTEVTRRVPTLFGLKSKKSYVSIGDPHRYDNPPRAKRVAESVRDLAKKILMLKKK